MDVQDEQNDEVKKAPVEIEIIEIYENSPKECFLRGKADIFIIIENVKIELREILWSVPKYSTKVRVGLPKTYQNVKVDDKLVKKSHRIIKFEPDIIHQIIAEAIQKEVKELYKDKMEQHQKTVEEAKQAAAKQKEEAQQAVSQGKKPALES